MTDSHTPQARSGFPPWSWAWLGVSAFVVALDVITKQRVSEALELYRPVEVLSWLNITLAHNYGAAFSFLSDAGGWQRWFFSGLAAVVCVILGVWLARLERHERDQLMPVQERFQDIPGGQEKGPAEEEICGLQEEGKRELISLSPKKTLLLTH